MPNEILVVPTQKKRLCSSLAQCEADVREAQRLRYRVFREELGACLPGTSGIESDFFDPFCDHLLVRDAETNEVVGTYRLLPALQAERIGGFYAETQFDLSGMFPLSSRLVEAGRACVHPDHRRGAVISLLWAGIAEYMQTRGHEYLIGCTNISMGDGGQTAAAIYQMLKDTHLSPAEWRVRPFSPLPVQPAQQPRIPPLPPLVKGYLRLGAYVCGEPAWDAYLNTADLCMLLPISRMSRRYARHFLKP
jgi:putative hemolysin